MMGTHFLAVAGLASVVGSLGIGKQESLFCGRAFPMVENASGLDADLEFVGCLDAECAADFKERGRVEVGYSLFFLDHLVATGLGQGARLTPKPDDLEAAIKGRSLDLRSSQQCGGVLV